MCYLCTVANTFIFYRNPLRSTKPLSITKTPEEWQSINEFILLQEKKDLESYLRSEIKRLKDQFTKCPKDFKTVIVVTKRKRPLIHRDQYNDLKEMGRKIKMNPSDIIVKFIIDPILERSAGR